MRRFVLIGMALILVACQKKEVVYAETPPSCSAVSARRAAQTVLTPIFREIADQKTRGEGCERLDWVLKDTDAWNFRDLKPGSCEWDYGSDGPYDQVKVLLEPHSSTIAGLCDWARKDAGAQLQQSGAATLDAMSPVDRATLERAFNGQ